MYYKLKCDSEYDPFFLSYVRNIKEHCDRSEFQYLDNKLLCWDIGNKKKFIFPDICFIDHKVPVISKIIWDKAMSVIDSDEIFQIPLVIKNCGEQHYYFIIVPSRIDCLDDEGKIVVKNVGRFHLFKTCCADDSTIYVSARLADMLKEFTALNFEGVD